MEKWLNLRLGHEIYKRSLKHLVVLESTQNNNDDDHTHTHTHTDGAMSKGHRNQLKELPMAKAEKVEQ